MSGGVFGGYVSDVGDSDNDDLRDIGDCMRCVLDENRRRGRAQRHRRVELSENDTRERSYNCPFFFSTLQYSMPSEETKVRSSLVLTASALIRIPQERVLKVVEFGRVRPPLRRTTT